MTSIEHITIEATDVAAAELFYSSAFGLGNRLRLRATDAPSSGFRGFTVSLIATQPADVSAIVDSAVAAGAVIVKAPAKSLWGFGGTVEAPDGTIWKVATSAKKDTRAASAEFDDIVLLLGCTDVSSSKRFYADRGLDVAKSFGSYVQFATPQSPIGLGLYKRAALAKDAGVPADGSGSHRLSIGSGAVAFTDPDGFDWEPAQDR